MKPLYNKLKISKGFSLAETLMAVLILLLVSSVIAAGIPAAANAYTKAVDAANAQALLSTTVNALRNELSTAWGVELSSDKSYVIYYSSKTGARTRIYQDSTGDGENVVPERIMVQDYLKYDKDNTDVQISGANPRGLVSDKAITKNLKVTWSGNLSLSDDIVTFSDVVVSKGDNPITKKVSVSVRILSPEMRVPELPVDLSSIS